jgi:hypothetical protein
MGMNFFSKPNISDVFKPIVGSGAVYEERSADDKKPATQMEMTIVGKEMTPNGEGYWMEIGHTDRQDNRWIYSKVLVTKDFEMTKVTFQMPGQGAMETPFNSKDRGDQNHRKEEMAKWSQVGTETITVPAGTFNCAHWKKDDGTEEIWSSDKVTPMAMVKQLGKNRNMVLVKQITGATDHITGPVTAFDPQAFAQGMKKRQP